MISLSPSVTPRPEDERCARELLQLLAHAHHQLDLMGIPPAPPRPILERTTW